MEAERYLVLIQFAAKITRANLTEVATLVTRAVRETLQNSEAICSTTSSVTFVGESRASADSLFRLLASDLRPGDSLSILSLGKCIATSHLGLHKWATRQGANQAAETGDP